MTPVQLSHRVGRLMGQNTRAAGAFKDRSRRRPGQGNAILKWEKVESWALPGEPQRKVTIAAVQQRRAMRSAADLYAAYTQLDRSRGGIPHPQNRPVIASSVAPEKRQRGVQAHVLVCFLAYVLWKTLGQMCRTAGLGDEPRKVLDEIAAVSRRWT